MRCYEIQNPPSVEHLIECFGRGRLPFILDSSQSNDGLGDWSFFGADPFLVFEGTGQQSSEQSFLAGERAEMVDLEGDPLERLRQLMSDYHMKNLTGIPFVGGAVGFLSYDYGRQLEHLPERATDDRKLPDIHFGFYDGIAALNHKTGVLTLVALGIREAEDRVIDSLKAVLASRPSPKVEGPKRGDWEWNMDAHQFCSAVEKVRAYIAAGDVYQVNLSRRARCRYEGDALQLFRALRSRNPSPYGAYLGAADFSIFSTSPEQFLRKRGRDLETRPIKGTRPRGTNTDEDKRLAEDLNTSEKDRAELLMIVDLERNDMGRVAEYGSVRVEHLYHLETYARVMHQTAQVKAKLQEGLDIFDAVRALFPGGSITGAPKIRAMEIIEELEPTRRGVYCGSIGYIGFNGDAELNIAIRSLHMKNGYLDYQVGSGIVWDSEPESELQETLDKGRAICEALDAVSEFGSPSI